MKKHHYTYLITDTTTGEFYYGSRSCDCPPQDDDRYLGSMSVWKPDKQNLKKEILEYSFKIRKQALIKEAELITKEIDNPLNRNYNIPPNRFYTVGTVTVRHIDSPAKKGNYIQLDKNDPRYLSGEYVGTSFGKVVVIDKNGNTLQVSKEDPKILSGEYKHYWTGRKQDESTIQKMKAKHSKTGHAQGSKNSQYGTMWIKAIDGKEKPKKLKKDSPVPKGWVKGR